MPTSWFQAFKLYLIDLTHLSRDALHIYAGLLIFFIVAFFHKRQLNSIWAWLSVLVVAVGVELLDAKDNIQTDGYWHVSASLHDIINTIFWPSILFCLAKLKVYPS